MGCIEADWARVYRLKMWKTPPGITFFLAR